MNTVNSIQHARSPFHILIKPIGPICNLRCEYCFYLTKTEMFDDGEQYRMSDEVLEETIRQYIAAQPPGTEQLGFGWQGGEPTLMGVDFFRRVVELQTKYARPDLEVINGLQTNGTLLDDEWGKFLHDEKFLVGLSIDGPAELHNRYRLDVQGRGTFEKVMAGMDVLKRHEVEYNVLTVVHSDNADHPREVYDFLADEGVTFLQFIPIVEHDRKGNVSNRSVQSEQFGRFLNGVFDRWLQRNDVGRVFVQQFDTSLAITMGYPAPLCVHAETCGRSTAMEHNGDLYSCDHWVFAENRLGNVMETSVTDMVDGDFQTGFGLDKSRKLPGYCKRCKYLRFCNGECPKDRIKTTPDGQSGLHYLCEGYKMFFEHSGPVFEKMADCLRMGRPVSDYNVIDQFKRQAQAAPRLQPTRSARPADTRPAAPRRNESCPCGSGKKYKKCCMKR
ncbi:Anaerobic sulfatase-maturating enzyme [Novipirellula artificiosorum]|uniref:Anaerobic sulfatase-maturating enzyme n=2 Tax=Novipirellula artificiosorum TaxID=2528016 RepID=A0A5C6DSV0_9BACT|nr:Anaerobic sulfatase-maturating enzyme [Novipirellula artificiosorum]